MKKKAIRFLEDGSYVDICDYKNCRNDAEKGYIVCKKHIGQNQRDYDATHITIGGMVFKADRETAKVFNR